MIRTRSRARNGTGFSIAPSYSYSFSSLPSAFTYTCTSTVLTYRDSSYKLRRSVTNVPRYNYDASGNFLGIMIEPQRVNRFSGSYIPTVTTGFSVTGTVTLTLGTDSTAITTAGLENIVSGNVYMLDGGVSGGTCLLAGTTGSTSNCSFSTYARVVSGSGATLTHSGTSAGSTNITGSAYSRFVLENQTISATTVQCVISVPAGCVVYFILPQIEVSPQVTSVIMTNGSSTTGTACNLQATSPSGFNAANGGLLLVGSYITRDTAQHFSFAFSDGTTSNYYAIRDGSDALYGACYVGGVLTSDSGSIVNPDRNVPFSQGMVWRANEITSIFGSGYSYVDDLVSGPTGNPTGLNKITLGCAGNNTTHASLHVKELYLWNTYVPAYVLGGYMFNSTWTGIITGGQSLIATDRRSQNESLPSGERAFNAVMDSVFISNIGKNVEIHGATSGSGLLKKNSSGTNWWYDPDTLTYGVAYETWETAAKSWVRSGGVIKSICYSGHENDYYGMDAGTTTKAEWKSAFLILVNKMRSIIGNVPVILEPIGRREDSATYDEGVQLMAEAQRELAEENPTLIYTAPEKVDLAIYAGDTVHLSASAQATKATRNAKKCLTVTGDISGQNVNGPKITAVSRSGSTVSLTVSFDTGETAITPTSAIAGVRFFDGASEISVTACTYSGGVITATLASVPANASQTLYLGYGGMFAEKTTIANYPKGNGSNTLPVHRAKFISSDTGASFSDALGGL